MILATINKTKKLVLLTYVGNVDVVEMERGVAELKVVLADMPAEFSLLADFERMESMDAAAATAMGDAMEILSHKGMSLVVRVFPDPKKDIGLNILSFFHYRGKVRAVTCKTMAEAVEALGW